MRTGVYGNHPQQQRGAGLEGIAHDRKWTKKISACVRARAHAHAPEQPASNAEPIRAGHTHRVGSALLHTLYFILRTV